ncbi:WD repeat domain phosphoinositide-interacting protein 4 [Dermatophagoides farinae]|uniref:WD repeat domain phosphoinositide-interacting protein 4 n=1 Tax=Dermatophagoides farinae TaxID=6954 RepID=A0A922I3W9_DERFA|nr:WD repeat domain phosphoinositide-interacting protein 4 [Dermatophagoides farinae]
MYKMVCVNGYNYMGVYYLIHLDDGGCGGLLWLAMRSIFRSPSDCDFNNDEDDDDDDDDVDDVNAINALIDIIVLINELRTASIYFTITLLNASDDNNFRSYSNQ